MLVTVILPPASVWALGLDQSRVGSAPKPVFLAERRITSEMGQKRKPVFPCELTVGRIHTLCITSAEYTVCIDELRWRELLNNSWGPKKSRGSAPHCTELPDPESNRNQILRNIFFVEVYNSKCLKLPEAQTDCSAYKHSEEFQITSPCVHHCTGKVSEGWSSKTFLHVRHTNTVLSVKESSSSVRLQIVMGCFLRGLARLELVKCSTHTHDGAHIHTNSSTYIYYLLAHILKVTDTLRLKIWLRLLSSTSPSQE